MVGGQRRSSENKGLIGNRIPSMGTVPKPSGRSASPAGSADSSVASAAAGSSTSPVTSRSSSPPTSPGGGLPSSLLAATLPDDGGPGAATPSSTIAEPGEDTSELSVPSTPLAGHSAELPSDMSSAHYDLVPSNLKLAAAEQMQRGLSATSATKSFAPSVSSSLAAQFDTSSEGSEVQQTMKNDVSGISTPTGTPRAAHRELDGSARGEGSVAGDADMEDIGDRLSVLGLDARDRDVTPGPGLEDPNKADDLKALKSGELQPRQPVLGQHTVDQNPINNIAEAGMGQNLDKYNILEEEMMEQSGEAGKRTGDEFDQPDVKPPTPPSGSLKNDGSDGARTEHVGTKGASHWFGAEFGSEGKNQSDSEVEHNAKSGLEDKEDRQTPPTVVAAASRSPPPAALNKESSGDTVYLPPPGTSHDNYDPTQKPMQVQIEPAPIAQPASLDDLGATFVFHPTDVEEPDESAADEPSPTFPSAPNDDPDVLQPIETGVTRTGTSTPIDATFLRSFPDVPDEEKPRVEVHVSSSPANTPQKFRSSSMNIPETPLADLPGTSKSLSHPPVEEEQTPIGSGGKQLSSLEVDTTPQPRESLSKRLSTRKSPKSPLLGDEDPGDFEPGEGWAVVTK